MRAAHSGVGRRGQRIDRVQEQAIATEATFWRKGLLRIINIITTLAMMSLALREHREHVDDGDCHGGNFLALLAMHTRFDPVLQNLLQSLNLAHPSREREREREREGGGREGSSGGREGGREIESLWSDTSQLTP